MLECFFQHKTCLRHCTFVGIDNKDNPDADLSLVYPEEGAVWLPAGVAIVKNAPNMDNAKAFVDFLFSDEAQQLVAEAYLLPGRSDVVCEGRTNLSDIPQLPTDWARMMEVASDTAAKLNSLCQ